MVRWRNSGWIWLENIYAPLNKGGLIILGNIAEAAIPTLNTCQAGDSAKRKEAELGLHLCVPLLRSRLYDSLKSGKYLPFPFKFSGERTVIKRCSIKKGKKKVLVKLISLSVFPL